MFSKTKPRTKLERRVSTLNTLELRSWTENSISDLGRAIHHGEYELACSALSALETLINELKKR